MKLLVALGNVFKTGSWENDTYFECDETWEENCIDKKDAENIIANYGFRIYNMTVNTEKQRITIYCY